MLILTGLGIGVGLYAPPSSRSDAPMAAAKIALLVSLYGFALLKEVRRESGAAQVGAQVLEMTPARRLQPIWSQLVACLFTTIDLALL